MKYLNIINYFLQWIWIAITVGAFSISIYNSDFGYAIILLYMLFFVGINHLLFSIVHLLAYGKESKFNIHLGLSAVVLFFLFSYRSISEYPVGEDLFAGTMVLAACLGIYFIMLVLTNYRPKRIVEHTYLDLD